MVDSSAQYEKDAQDLRDSMEGFGTNEEKITAIIANRSNADRQQIIKFYKSSFGEDLIADLKSELGGDFEKLVLALFQTHIDYDVSCLYNSMKGAGTDEDTLIEIIASRPTSQLKEIITSFQQKYGQSLEEFVADETSGDIKRMLISLLQCNRSENTNIDEDAARQDAQALFDAGEGKWGTDESVFNKIFTLRSPMELLSINQHYQDISGTTLLDAIDTEFSGDMHKLLKAVLYSLILPSQYYATRIKKAVEGWGTNDSLLVRLIVSREEKDMAAIRNAYQNMYGEDLLKVIADETSGDYKRLLLKLASH